jgi:LuxR family maltose regulon positive regulatory protein
VRKSADALASVPPSAESDALRKELGEFLTVVEMMGSLLAAAYSGQDLDQVCERALEARGRALEAGNPFMAAHILNGLAMGRFHQGRLTEAAGHYRELVDLGHQGAGSQVPLAAVGHIGLAAVSVERNELEAAEQHLNEGARLGRHRVGANTLVSAAVTRSRLREYAGDHAGAWAALDEAARIRRVKESGPAGHRLTRQRVWLHLAAGEMDQAEVLARRLGEKLERAEPAVFREAEQILLARMDLRRGDPARALQLLDEPEATAHAGKRAGRLIEIHLLQALACQAQGRSSDALGYLEQSLGLAEPEGYVRFFLDEGGPAVALLRGFCRAPGPPRLHQVAQTLLEALDASSPEAGKNTPAARPALIEPLTRRQREVLRLLVEGLSAPEIAQELVVAPSTVRSHLKAIYRKLEVHGRHEAVERARALGLA